MPIMIRLLLAFLSVLVLLSTSVPAQTVQLGLFGEGLFSRQTIGGIGGRATFRAVRWTVIEAEATRYFHSEAFSAPSGQRLYNTGYQVLIGPAVKLPLHAYDVFLTAKGGLFHSTTKSEDPAQSAPVDVTSGAIYIGGGTQIGSSFGFRLDAGDEILLRSEMQRNNARVSAGVFLQF